METEAYESTVVGLTVLSGQSEPGEVALIVEHGDGFTTETSCPLDALASVVHQLNPCFVTIEENGGDAAYLKHLIALALHTGTLH